MIELHSDVLERIAKAVEKIASMEEKILDNQTAILRLQEHIMVDTLEQKDMVERWIEKIEDKEKDVTSTEDDNI